MTRGKQITQSAKTKHKGHTSSDLLEGLFCLKIAATPKCVQHGDALEMNVVCQLGSSTGLLEEKRRGRREERLEGFVEALGIPHHLHKSPLGIHEGSHS